MTMRDDAFAQLVQLEAIGVRKSLGQSVAGGAVAVGQPLGEV